MPLQQVNFKTNIFAGTKEAEGTGTALARLVTAGMDTANKFVSIAKQNEAELARKKALSEREQESEDWLTKLEQDTKREEWETANNFGNMTALEQRDSDYEFNENNAPIYATEKYQKTHEYNKAKWKNDNQTKIQGELDTEVKTMALGWASSHLNLTDAIDGKSVSEQVSDSIREYNDTSNKFKSKDMYTSIVDATMNEILTDTSGKYENMSGGELRNYFTTVGVIKDADIKKPFTDYVNDRYILDLAKDNNYMSIDNINAISKATSMQPFEVQNKVTELNKTRMPMLLQGDLSDVAEASDINENSNGIFDDKFLAVAKSRLNNGDPRFYYATKGRIQYPQEFGIKVSGLEFLAQANGWDLTNPEHAVQAVAMQKSNKAYEVKITDREIDEHITGIWSDMDKNRVAFYRANMKQAQELGANKDDVFSILANEYEKQEVDGLAIRGLGIDSEEQLEDLKKYVFESGGGDTNTEIKQSGLDGWLISHEDTDGNKISEFKTDKDMKILIKDSKELTSAFVIMDSLIQEDFSNLSDGEKRTATAMNRIVDEAISNVTTENNKALTKEDIKKLNTLVKVKYKKIVEDIWQGNKVKRNAIGQQVQPMSMKKVRKATKDVKDWVVDDIKTEWSEWGDFLGELSEDVIDVMMSEEKAQELGRDKRKGY